jgi:hypothetical protein
VRGDDPVITFNVVEKNEPGLMAGLDLSFGPSGMERHSDTSSRRV